jgi:hypothetical protein
VLAGYAPGRGTAGGRPARGAAAGLAALVLAASAGAAACSAGAPTASTGAQRTWIGELHGDAASRCLWLADSGSEPVEVVMAADVTVRFTPEVQLDSPRYGILRAGQTLAVSELGTSAGRPGCPLRPDHRTVLGEPGPWNGTTQITPPAKTH